MARINVYAYPTSEYDGEGPKLDGWFRPESATEYKEDTIDGEKSVNPVPQFSHQALYRTAQGRWVLCTWSQYEGTESRYEFVGDDTAKSWLLRNHEDEAAEKWFGELDEESGPNLGGRPEIGPKIEVRFPKDVLERIDSAAKAQGVSRAQWLRDLADQHA